MRLPTRQGGVKNRDKVSSRGRQHIRFFPAWRQLDI